MRYYLDQLKALLHPQMPETQVPKVPKAPFVTSVTSLPAHFRQISDQSMTEAFEERAGILQFDAGMSRQDAEALAASLLRWRPTLVH
jgi:hypothetical protein